MNTFVGIDLGTTNSAICSYNGSEIRVWKSPEQNDVTPSAIYIDRRGNKYVGKRAYDAAPHSPDNSATLFKRLMGTSTPVKFTAVNLTKNPEECSAEVLKVLFGYLPEDVREDPDLGTVITVPAAFNQMQKSATMQAADMAGIGKVALMQEPVAAVMSVMRTRKADGIFLIYDLGGGTLDVAIAESIGGRVTLLANGGIAMCGGRDFDRVLVDNIVSPWLRENFKLPDNFTVQPSFKTLRRLTFWATERAKIELSACENSVVSLSEAEARVKDLDGNDIYLDIPLQRSVYDKLISERIDETLRSVRDTLHKAGLSSQDLERVVFIGGPTNYKPLRDKVAFELGISIDTNINPMTAVSEGASLFAESIDWSSQNRSRKSVRGHISTGGSLAPNFNYIARTPDAETKIAVLMDKEAESGAEFQVDSRDTGWTSGRLPLKHGVTVDVALAKNGDNSFTVSVFDSLGSPVSLEKNKIVITRTAATVDAIPASHSIGIEVLDKLGGRSILDYLIRSGDSLPKKGKKTFKAAEMLRAGSSKSLNFKLWEGEIEEPISDNRPIGVLKISGSDFDEGVISSGADLECDYEILDSGTINIEVSVPCIGGVFRSDRNFYSRQEGQLDYTEATSLVFSEGRKTLDRIDELDEAVSDPRLERVHEKLMQVISLEEQSETEAAQEAMEEILEARRVIAKVRKDHLKKIRQTELDKAVESFDEIREYANPSELTSFDNLAQTAQRSIERNDGDFEQLLSELKGRSLAILWKQSWFVVGVFTQLISEPNQFTDKQRFNELVAEGKQHVASSSVGRLRNVVAELIKIKFGDDSDDQFLDVANIVRG